MTKEPNLFRLRLPNTGNFILKAKALKVKRFFDLLNPINFCKVTHWKIVNILANIYITGLVFTENFQKDNTTTISLFYTINKIMYSLSYNLYIYYRLHLKEPVLLRLKGLTPPPTHTLLYRRIRTKDIRIVNVYNIIF